jgi:hypothetical protein
MRWMLVIGGGIIGAILLLTILPHSQHAQPTPYKAEVPHVIPGKPQQNTTEVPRPVPAPVSPQSTSTPPITTTVKCGIIALGLVLLFSFKESEKVQSTALTLIASGALALLGQTLR